MSQQHLNAHFLLSSHFCSIIFSQSRIGESGSHRLRFQSVKGTKKMRIFHQATITSKQRNHRPSTAQWFKRLASITPVAIECFLAVYEIESRAGSMLEDRSLKIITTPKIMEKLKCLKTGSCSWCHWLVVRVFSRLYIYKKNRRLILT